MAQSNKILTVSYGTFSCTLEGFDNPFGTMQSIAEYFRDLAAEDRYFGAEPPQPDAQMLHQIAEREVRRRVEARVGDNGVVLRQMAEADEAAAQPAPPPAAPPPAAAPAPPAPEAAEAPETEVAGTEATGTETVAERLARIRAVVAKARAQRDRTYEEDEQVVDDRDESLLTAFAEAEDAELAEEDDFAAEAAVDDDSEPSLAAADALDEDDEEDPGRSVEDAAPEAESAPTEPKVLSQISGAQQVGAADGVATIAVGLTADPSDRAEAEPSVPEAAEAAEKSDAEIDQSSPDVSVPTAAATPELEDAPEDEGLSASEGQAPLADEGAEAEAAKDTAEDDADETAPSEAAVDEADMPEDASAGDTRPDAGAADAAPTPETTAADEAPEDQEDASPDHGAAETAEEADGDDWVEVEVEDDDGIPRVVKMSRAEFEEALANGELEEIDDDDEAEGLSTDAEDTIREILAETDLNEADASALAAELAAVERGTDPEDEAAHVTEGMEPAKDDASGDQTITRLLDEANAQLDEPEGHRRRSAIQHLRAAVAATKADGRLRDRSSDASIQRFRDDLQKAVRPRRPETTGGSERPRNLLGRPSPLVLVSSQRVDAVRPVRPLRDASAARTPVDVSKPAEKQTFVDFAAKLGARELPDLLEAAAAYSKIVEGQEGAPRPVLIRRATEAAPDGAATREEGLKSFGQLLRSGRIRKIEAGRFALAEDAEMAKKARIAN